MGAGEIYIARIKINKAPVLGDRYTNKKNILRVAWVWCCLSVGVFGGGGAASEYGGGGKALIFYGLSEKAP